MKTTKLLPGILAISLAVWAGVAAQAQAQQTSALALQQLYAFPTSAPDPWHPATRLVEGTDGSFYGTTGRGGASDMGTVFKVTASGAFTLLLSFNGSNGEYPLGGLVLGKDGSFYGATGGNNATNFGTVFRMTPGGALTTLFSFQGTNGSTPHGRLVQGSDGNFYGTTRDGGAFGLGTAFVIAPTGALTTLISFAGTNGANPTSGLVAADNGMFYGATQYGGSNFIGAYTGYGTVFSVTASGALTTLAYFNLTNGSQPRAVLAPASDGSFYGTASGGGANNLGTVFRLTPGRALTTVLDFGPTGGVRPFGGVTEGSHGDFYGTTAYCLNSSILTNGTVFKVTTGGVMTTLANLNGTNGLHPFTDLVLASDGNLYGTMADATLNHSVNGGTIFRLAQRPVITSVASSSGSNTLAWSSFSNGIYRVERKAWMAGATWTTLSPTLTASGPSSSFSEPSDGTAGYYYRVVLLP